MKVEQIQRKLLELTAVERLRLVRWLLNTLSAQNVPEITTSAPADVGNPLIRIAGLFSGGPGDSAERVEEILTAEVDPIHGLGTRDNDNFAQM